MSAQYKLNKHLWRILSKSDGGTKPLSDDYGHRKKSDPLARNQLNPAITSSLS